MKKIFLLFCICISIAASAQSVADRASKNNNLDKGGLAIKGYDPVSYFTIHKAVEGKKDISFNHNGATYYFSSVQDRELFKASPERYTPQYGGWCAYAMGSTGEKVEIDPETFQLLDGKLYLFYNRFFNNTKKSWEKDEMHLKTQADKNWQSLIK